MSTLLLWQRLSAEKAQLESFLARTAEGDVLGRISLESRIAELSEQIEQYSRSPKTKAEVALIFYGAPVTGSSAVRAAFGSRAIEAFQKSVSTAFAQQAGDVGERGPTKARDLSSLHITGVVHGSFGFVLEEIDAKGDQLFDTSLKAATESVIATLDQIASDDESIAEQAINEISERLFVNVKELVALFHDNEASLNMVGPEIATELEGTKLERAYQRTADARITDEVITLRGVLQGLLPVSRKFEFQAPGEVIKGSVAKDISEQYLQTLESSPMTGHAVQAKFKKRTLIDKLGNIKHYYTLVEILPDDIAPSHPLIASPD